MSRAYFRITETTPAAPGTVASSGPVQSAAGYLVGGVAGPLSDYDAVDIIAELVGATGGSLDVYIQLSPNDGIDWFDIVHFTQLSSGAAAVKYQVPISNATATTAPAVVGKNLNPALTSPQVVNGTFSDRFRAVFVAGSGTSAGATAIIHISPQRADAPYFR